MLIWLQLVPPLLILFTLILVIIPTFATVCLRYSLYQHLINSATKITRLLKKENRGQQPKIVDNLEIRFKEARANLEQVNTMALIDGVYSQEKFTCFGISLNCEQWDYFCKILPNLLLAFGLLGTFFGITKNLSNISQTLARGSGDVSSLIANLQIPLQGMGIAFVTSLTAIFCSSLLIIFNFLWNTNLAKSFLISSLEDYLDNVFQRNIKGRSRIDLAIDRMVKQQEEFLTRFHEKVGQVLETTIGDAANKMVTANQNFQNNVDSLVSRFHDVSGSLAASTNSWQQSTFSLAEQIKTITEIVPQIEASSRRLENGSAIFQLAANKIEQSKFSDNLEKLTSNLATTQIAFSESTESLNNRVIKFAESYEKVGTQLQQTADKLQTSSFSFVEAAEKIQQSDFTERFDSTTQEFSKIIQSFCRSSNLLNDVLAPLQNHSQSINNLVKQTNILNQNSNNLLKSIDKSETNNFNYELIEQSANNLQKIVSEINKITSSLENTPNKKNIFRIFQ